MQQLQHLLNLAIERAGSISELARRTGASRTALQHMKAGKQPVSATLVPLLAEVAGEDPHHWAEYALMAHASPERRPMLERVLGKSLAGVTLAGAAVSASAGTWRALIDCVFSQVRPRQV